VTLRDVLESHPVLRTVVQEMGEEISGEQERVRAENARTMQEAESRRIIEELKNG
jgi:hypothetical protein